MKEIIEDIWYFMKDIWYFVYPIFWNNSDKDLTVVGTFCFIMMQLLVVGLFFNIIN